MSFKEPTGGDKWQIQTLNHLGGWVDCQHENWEHLKSDGWTFEYLSPEGWAMMSRKGYLNAFRTKLIITKEK